QRVADVRLRRLVVRRHRAVHHPGGGEQPATPVGLHDERVRAGQRRGAALARIARVVGSLGRPEVGDVPAGPRPGLLVPPDPLLPLAPGPTLGVGGGAVVEDPTVRGPGPAPVGGGLVLLLAGGAPAGAVHAAGVDAGVDPAATHRGAV